MTTFSCLGSLSISVYVSVVVLPVEYGIEWQDDKLHER